MTNYREIIRMSANGFSHRAISKSLHCHRDTIANCLKRAGEQEILWPLGDDVTNEQLQRLLYPESHKRDDRYVVPDHARIDEDLKKPNMTLTLLWHRYITDCVSQGKQGYQFTQYCELYRRYRRDRSLSVRLDRNPGEMLELDWAGDALYIYDPLTEVRIKASLFVASWAFSNYFYTEAFLDQKLRSWIKANDNALQYFGGVPLMLVPDNTKTAVIKADRYEPDLHEAFQEFAEHYRTVIIPARVKHPKDKPNVEGSVGFVTRRIIADLADQVFFSLDDLNQAIWERMDALNCAPFTKKPISRLQLFESMEKKALLPLPSGRFTLYERKTATVAPDYHVQFDTVRYSVPYKYIRCNVLVTASIDEVLISTEQDGIIARHRRSRIANQAVTESSHQPENGKAVSSWNSATFRHRADAIGPHARAIIDAILASREFEVQAYRSCLGVLNLAHKYGGDLLELACKQAVELGIRSRKGIKGILSSLDQQRSEDWLFGGETASAAADTLAPYYCCHGTADQQEVRHE